MRLSAASLTAALLLWTAQLTADEAPRTISTSGESVVYVTPDEVIVNFGVETLDPSLEQAKSVNDRAGAKLVAAIKKMGVDDKHIQTDNLDIEIRYKRNEDVSIYGYMARRGYSVTLKDTKKFGELVETAIKNGANRLAGFDYRTTELRKYRDQARTMAITAAREKAEKLANDLACSVGHPRTIQEGGGYWGYSGSRWGNTTAVQNSVQVAAGAAGDGGEALPMGQIAVRAQVSVTFDLVPPKSGKEDRK